MESASTSILCERLRRIPSAIVSDVLSAMGLPDQVLAFGLRPLRPPEPFAGPAVCFGGESGVVNDPPGRPRLVYEADRRITRGCIAVLSTRGHQVGAAVGGNTIVSWRLRGCAGLVTDGLVRDSADFAGLPTFCAGATPINNRGRWSYRSVDEPVHMPGQTTAEVTVHPGDIVHGDLDGVLVVPLRHLENLVAYAEITAAVESRMRAEIEAGDDREAVYERNDRFGHIREVEPGQRS